MDDIIIRVLNGKAEPMEELRLANWRGESSHGRRRVRGEPVTHVRPRKRLDDVMSRWMTL